MSKTLQTRLKSWFKTSPHISTTAVGRVLRVSFYEPSRLFLHTCSSCCFRPTPVCRGAAPPRCRLQPCWPPWCSLALRFPRSLRTHSSSEWPSTPQDASACKETHLTSVYRQNECVSAILVSQTSHSTMRVCQKFIDSCDLEKFCDQEISLIDNSTTDESIIQVLKWLKNSNSHVLHHATSVLVTECAYLWYIYIS